jgi:hypothetical protein
VLAVWITDYEYFRCLGICSKLWVYYGFLVNIMLDVDSESDIGSCYLGCSRSNTSRECYV